MDKDKSRAIYVQHGLDIAEGGDVRVEDLARDHVYEPPYVIKPIAEGSSFGVFIVREGANRPPKELTDGTWKFGKPALVEKFIPGRELTVGVMGDRAMAVTEITTLREYYDFEAKYEAGGSRHVLPADLPNAVTEAALDASLRAHQRSWLPGRVAVGLSLRRKSGSTGDTRDQYAAGHDAHLAHPRAGRAYGHRLSLARPLDDRGRVMPKVKRPQIAGPAYDDELDAPPRRRAPPPPARRARDIPYSVAWFRDRIATYALGTIICGAVMLTIAAWMGGSLGAFGNRMNNGFNVIAGWAGIVGQGRQGLPASDGEPTRICTPIDGQLTAKVLEAAEVPMAPASCRRIPHGIRDRIEKLDVGAVSVQRLWPDRIRIDVEQRKPIALSQEDGEGGAWRVVDQSGRAFAEADLTQVCAPAARCRQGRLASRRGAGGGDRALSRISPSGWRSPTASTGGAGT